jgi:hypothetical protein
MEAHDDSDVEELTPEERMAKEEFDRLNAEVQCKFNSLTVQLIFNSISLSVVYKN